MRSGRSRFVLLLLIVTALSLVTLDFRGFGPLGTVQRSVRGLFEPMVGVGDLALSPFRNAWRGVTDYSTVERENAELRLQIEKLESDPLRQQNAQQQLDELKAQLQIVTAANTDVRIARVISGPVANFENNVRIDKGSSSGIRPAMVVVTAAGLVGRVAEVTDSQAVVELMDSRNFGVGVRPASAVAPTNFVLRGQGAGRPLHVQGELAAGSVQVGDAVVTSGLDRSAFPPDIVVGAISRVPDPSGAAGGSNRVSAVEVTPVVDPSSLSFVTVLLWERKG